jgi:hypothetical protein
MGRACYTTGDKKNAYRILVGKTEGKRPLGRLRHRWVDNIKMDLTEIGWDDMDWTDLAQVTDQGPVEASCGHGNEHSSSIKCWDVLE